MGKMVKIMKRMINYLVIDVDGTMTDAGIYYDNDGNEIKKFCTRDAAGIGTAKALGIKILILTGRECLATRRRMTELKVDYLYQGVTDKASFLQKFMSDNLISKFQIGYIGDDLNDLSSMKLVGFVGCPADACREVKMVSDYVSSLEGGKGAVRDIIEYLLKESGEWDKAIAQIYL